MIDMLTGVHPPWVPAQETWAGPHQGLPQLCSACSLHPLQTCGQFITHLTHSWLVVHVYCFMSSSNILHSYRDLTVTGDGLQNSGIWLALEAFVHLNKEESLSCYTCCDAGKQRILKTYSSTDLYIKWNKSYFYGKLIIIAYHQLYR